MNEYQEELNKLAETLNGEYKGRKIIFISMYGSHNYGTNDEDSDFDFKVWLMPTMKDLIRKIEISTNDKIEGNDIEFKDIRLMKKLLSSSHPTYLETLVSKEYWIPKEYEDFVAGLRDLREEIANINLKKYYFSTGAMAKNKLKAIEKDLPRLETNNGYQRRMKYGFDTKQLLHIVRLMAMRNEVFHKGVSPLDVIDLRQDFKEDSYLYGLLPKLADIKSNANNLTKEQAIELGISLITDEREELGIKSIKGNLKTKDLISDCIDSVLEYEYLK